MNRLELFRGLGNLDADLIREAEASPARKQKKAVADRAAHRGLPRIGYRNWHIVCAVCPEQH